MRLVNVLIKSPANEPYLLTRRYLGQPHYLPSNQERKHKTRRPIIMILATDSLKRFSLWWSEILSIIND